MISRFLDDFLNHFLLLDGQVVCARNKGWKLILCWKLLIVCKKNKTKIIKSGGHSASSRLKVEEQFSVSLIMKSHVDKEGFKTLSRTSVSRR